MLCGLTSELSAQCFALNVLIAFLPLAVLGLLFGKVIKAHLFNAPTVAATFILGGIFILWAERREHRIRVETIDELSAIDALKLGLAQALALIPGTSRSGATIFVALLAGTGNRAAATEFAFLVGIPTMFAATGYELLKLHGAAPAAGARPEDWAAFSVAFVTSAVVAFVAVKWLLRYVQTHRFTVFAWYRIVAGIALLALAR